MCLLLFLTTQPQGFHDLGVRCRVAADLIDDGEASGVVPHGPANAVLLESSADVGDPAGAIGGGGKGAGIGAGAGAALGTTAGILMNRNLRLEKGTQLELRLDRPLTLPAS